GEDGRRIRHDVMAHIHHLGEQAPTARPFIHLGATSAYVTDNADLILMREGLQLLLGRVAAVLVALAKPARRYRDVACLAYTHFQPAQLTTVGKRITLWMQELLLDAEEVLHRLETLQFAAGKGLPERRPASWGCSAAAVARWARLTPGCRGAWGLSGGSRSP